MKIGIDISQLAFSNTGVANYLKNLLTHLLEIDTKNEYVLFFSSLREKMPDLNINNVNVSIKKYKIPLTVLDVLWNRLHRNRNLCICRHTKYKVSIWLRVSCLLNCSSNQ